MLTRYRYLTAKLPDPSLNPNVGSFFKNQIIDQSQAADFEGLGLSVYSTEVGVKLSAAQLIDRCGWKDKPGNEYVAGRSSRLFLLTMTTLRLRTSWSLPTMCDSVAETFAVQLERAVSFVLTFVVCSQELLHPEIAAQPRVRGGALLAGR